jgi:protease PrsW
MNYLFPIFFGIAPSFIWLLFYLKKDHLPEPNKMILRIFFYGMLATIPVLFLEISVAGALENLVLPSLLKTIIYWFFCIAFIEEIFKFLVVKYKVLNNPHFDEPVDVMIYMIVSALGFAALENILALLSSGTSVAETAIISSMRFLGATFLHTLCSGTIGYFLAISLQKAKKKKRTFIFGLFLAVVLHGLFNIFIIGNGKSWAIFGSRMAITNPSLFAITFIFLILILAGLAIFVLSGFKKLKKLKSVCQIH